jgi:hypothetical protein
MPAQLSPAGPTALALLADALVGRCLLAVQSESAAPARDGDRGELPGPAGAGAGGEPAARAAVLPERYRLAQLALEAGMSRCTRSRKWLVHALTRLPVHPPDDRI